MTDRRRTRTPARPGAAPAVQARRVWSLHEIQALGATTDVVTAGQILGLSRNSAYTLARRGTFPVPVIKAGTRYRIPVAALLAVLHPHPHPGQHAQRQRLTRAAPVTSDGADDHLAMT